MKKILLTVAVMAALAFTGQTARAESPMLAALKKNNELRVGFDPGYMPFEMTDKSGNYIGFDIDLGRDLAKALGVKYVPVAVNFDGIIPALQTKKIDIILSAMTVTDERAKSIDFSTPYIMAGQSILLHKRHENKITSWEQLNDPKYTVVSRQGTTSEEAARRMLPRAKHKTFEKESDGALEVANNRGDAWVYDLPFNVVFMAQQGTGKLIHLDKPFTEEPLAIGINKGDPEFLAFINDFLKQYRESGRYDRLYNKWIKSTDWFARTQR